MTEGGARRSAGVFFFGCFGDGYVGDGVLGEAMADCDCGDTQHDGKDDICQSSAPRAGAGEIESLQAEGGEGGKSAADTDHDEETNVFGDRMLAAMQGQRAEVSDDEGAEHVDEDGAKGESAAVGEGKPGDGVTQESAQSTADRNPEIRHVCLVLREIESTISAEVISQGYRRFWETSFPSAPSYNMGVGQKKPPEDAGGWWSQDIKVGCTARSSR